MSDIKSGSSDPDSIAETFRRFGSVLSRNMYFCTIAKIESYDPLTQSADIKPLLKKPDSEDGDPIFQEQPVVTMCPVLWLRLGGFVIRGPISKGDLVLILHTDYQLDEFFNGDGSIVDPISRRTHHLSDAIVIPLSPARHADAIANLDDGDHVIARENGDGGLRIKPDGKMELGSDSATKRGIARLDDQVKSTSAEDAAFWQWVNSVNTFISSIAGVAGMDVTPVGVAASTYVASSGGAPSACTGKIIEASDKNSTE